MNNYIKAIGFSNENSRIKEEDLIDLTIMKSNDRSTALLESGNYALSAFYPVGSTAGLVVDGEMDKGSELHVERIFPVIKGRQESVNATVSIHKRMDSDSYTGMCEDDRFGLTLIFFLINKIDLLKSKKEKGKKYSVNLSGLSTNGVIILPVLQQIEKPADVVKEKKQENSLLDDEEMSDEEALTQMAMLDISRFAMLGKRLQKEDVYSIVESSLTPYGSESDNYSILAFIKKVELYVNNVTKEKFYILTLTIQNMDLDVCINKKDLLGEPAAGRRFSGRIWLQGVVKFDD